MDFNASYHNHTVWSDGDDTMANMILAAIKAGLPTFGISDHWAIHPDIDYIEWALPKNRLDDYVQSVLSFKREYDSPTFKLLLGIEVDFFQENAHEVIAELKKYPFDYIIGSVHYAGTFPIDHTKEDWLDLPDDNARDQVFHQYWKSMKQLCESKLYDIVGHFDLPKKFCFAPKYDASQEIEDALQALKASGMTMELNSAGFAKDCGEAYPSPAILKRAQQLDIPLVISEDAHAVEHVARFRNQARQLIQNTKNK